MLRRIPFLAAHFQKGITMMKTILTAVILAGLFAVAGCSQTTVEQPTATGSNGAETPATTGHNDGEMGPGHMPGGRQHGPGHQDGRGQP